MLNSVLLDRFSLRRLRTAVAPQSGWTAVAADSRVAARRAPLYARSHLFPAEVQDLAHRFDVPVTPLGVTLTHPERMSVLDYPCRFLDTPQPEHGLRYGESLRCLAPVAAHFGNALLPGDIVRFLGHFAHPSSNGLHLWFETTMGAKIELKLDGHKPHRPDLWLVDGPDTPRAFDRQPDDTRTARLRGLAAILFDLRGTLPLTKRRQRTR